MQVRKIQKQELFEALAVIEEGRQYMKEAGIPQWQNGYPDLSTLQEDCEKGNGYVLCEEDRIIGYAAILFEKDPCYDYIEGKWLNEEPYAVIHRSAVLSSRKGKGVAGWFVEYAAEKAREKGIRNLRIDTHERNLPMRRFVEKQGFVYCGTVYMNDGTPRRGYQKELRKEHFSSSNPNVHFQRSCDL